MISAKAIWRKRRTINGWNTPTSSTTSKASMCQGCPPTFQPNWNSTIRRTLLCIRGAEDCTYTTYIIKSSYCIPSCRVISIKTFTLEWATRRTSHRRVNLNGRASPRMKKARRIMWWSFLTTRDRWRQLWQRRQKAPKMILIDGQNWRRRILNRRLPLHQIHLALIPAQLTFKTITLTWILTVTTICKSMIMRCNNRQTDQHMITLTPLSGSLTIWIWGLFLTTRCERHFSITLTNNTKLPSGSRSLFFHSQGTFYLKIKSKSA